MGLQLFAKLGSALARAKKPAAVKDRARKPVVRSRSVKEPSTAVWTTSKVKRAITEFSSRPVKRAKVAAPDRQVTFNSEAREIPSNFQARAQAQQSEFDALERCFDGMFLAPVTSGPRRVRQRMGSSARKAAQELQDSEFISRKSSGSAKGSDQKRKTTQARSQGTTALESAEPIADINQWESDYAALVASISTGMATDPVAQPQTPAFPSWSEVADEHRTPLHQTLRDGIEDQQNPKAMLLWFDVMGRFEALGWDIALDQDIPMAALFALDPAEQSEASSAIAMAWVCATENEVWREDNGGARNDALEANPWFFPIFEKVNQYMSAWHGKLMEELSTGPVTTPNVAAELDDLIAHFENMTRP